MIASSLVDESYRRTDRSALADAAKIFRNMKETRIDITSAQFARGSRADAGFIAALLNILRDDRDSTVNRVTARTLQLAR